MRRRHLGVGQRACHLCCRSCKQLTHHDEWTVCRERWVEGGSRSGMVGVMIRDREVERELCLGLSMLQRCLIEGCFNAVWGWQVGIIIAICLRSRHPDWLLMAAACVVLPSTRGGFDFHYRVENISLVSSAFLSWFTRRRWILHNWWGGGVACWSVSSPWLESCRVDPWVRDTSESHQARLTTSVSAVVSGEILYELSTLSIFWKLQLTLFYCMCDLICQLPHLSCQFMPCSCRVPKLPQVKH